MENALILFVKNPERGKVKTRLARTLGDERALAIYRKLLRNTRQVARAVTADRLVFYGEFIDADDEWIAPGFRKYLQAGDDLGERMHRAFDQVLRTEGYRRAVLVGSDIAALTPAIIEEAFAKLDRHAFVIGPATDGGYYLIGMKQPAPTLFENLPWSTPTVCEETRRRMRALGHEPYLLPELSDVDREEDWRRERGKMKYEV